jgi:hypothetical protein
MQGRVLIECVLLVSATLSAMVRAQLSQSSAAEGQAADLNTIISRLEKAQADNRQHLRAYTLVRGYRLFSKGSQTPNSEVTAQISFAPPNSKTFQIENATGSSRGEKITRSLLEHEVEAGKEPQQSTFLNRENYDFTYLGQESVEEHPCYVLQLRPKDKRPSLLQGRAWVDESTYLPRYAEGDLSKTPSWWLKRVHVKLSFSELGGMWLETATQAVATMRWFGEHTLTSRTVEFRAATSVAQRHGPTQSPLGPSRKIEPSG